MDLQSARGIKQQIRAKVLSTLTSPAMVSAWGISARRLEGRPVVRSIAVGIAPTGLHEFRIAVRVQRSELSQGEHMEAIREQAKGEMDVRYVGRVYKANAASLQTRVRPLIIGSSIGHFRITAGSLGCFVQSRTGLGRTMILSNNHVLADENRAAIGDPILQPGPFDGWILPDGAVATLTRFQPLQTGRANIVDCAVAEIAEGIQVVSNSIEGIGAFQSSIAPPLQMGDTVRKTGRTTGTTTGRITAFELDNLVVGYEIGDLRFDNQIEVEGSGDSPFSRGGDSGSIVVNQEGRAIGLLFAGGDTGGSNGLGLTFLNPIGDVLDELNVELVTASSAASLE